MAVSKELSENVVFLPTEKEINVFGIQSGRKLGKLGGHYGFVKCCFYDGFSQVMEFASFENFARCFNQWAKN